MTCENNICTAMGNIIISSKNSNSNKDDDTDTDTMGTAISISSSSSSSSSLEYDCNCDTEEEEEESIKFYYDDDDDDDERIAIFKQMKLLEETTYKRPHYTDIPETFRGLWRKQIVEWMYVLIKHCKLRKETTAAAIYYLDVAVSLSDNDSSNSNSNLCLVQTPKDYQLCAMTALHLALKVYDSPTIRIVKLNCLVKLSNNEFTEQDIIDKEQQLIDVLNWKLHPPTSNCFLYRYLELLPVQKQDQDQDQDHQQQVQQQDQDHQQLEEIASEIIEVAMAHDRFLAVPSSTIAYSALLLAMEQQQQHQNINSSINYYWSTFVRNMKDVAGMGDIFFMNDNNDDNDDNNNISRSVLRTKMLLDRIVIQGLPLLPEDDDDENENDDDDDDDEIYSTTMTRIKSMCSFSGDDDDEPSRKMISTTPQPPSPTSTMSSNTTTATTNVTAARSSITTVASPPL
jgi:hypothetical protein